MLQAAVLAAAVLTGVIQVWHIIVLSLLLGVVNAFDIPIRQSFIVELVSEREDLSNAIALNSSIVQAARLIGPAIAGLLVASVGEGICFVLNSVSYLAVLLALVAMKLAPRSLSEKPRRNVLRPRRRRRRLLCQRNRTRIRRRPRQVPAEPAHPLHQGQLRSR